jgi:long-subunit fatty acid transport protein
MVSLGGDGTANIVNPAGLAFYKTSDVLFSPGLQLGKDQSNFRGTNYTGKALNKFQLGTSGIILGGFGYKAKNSFALTITQRANFNRPVHYRGSNDYSSFAEPLADEFAASHLSIDEALNSDISLTTKMAIYTYLVDTATINGTKQVIARSETGLVNQEMDITSSGGITEVTLGGAHEVNKKVFVGGSIGIPIISLDRSTYFRETDATGNPNNNFRYLAYRENYKLTGAGFNLRVGVIYRPKEYIRLGLALHSPDILTLKEHFDAGFAADLENLFSPNTGYDSVGAATVYGSTIPDVRYSLYTPGRIMISGAYVFREVENVKKQKGFVSADIEYINYTWNRFGADQEETSDSKTFYRPYNQAIDALCKSAFNFRIGGELKFNIIMARLGFAYYSSPYRDKQLKAHKMNLSGGLGYRNKGVFVDLGYVYRINKDVHFPYRVNSPRANTFATAKDNGGTIILTVGCKI